MIFYLRYSRLNQTNPRPRNLARKRKKRKEPWHTRKRCVCLQCDVLLYWYTVLFSYTSAVFNLIVVVCLFVFLFLFLFFLQNSLSTILFVMWWCLLGGAIVFQSWDSWMQQFDRDPQRQNTEDKELVINWILRNTGTTV